MSYPAKLLMIALVFFGLGCAFVFSGFDQGWIVK